LKGEGEDKIKRGFAPLELPFTQQGRDEGKTVAQTPVNEGMIQRCQIMF
jgi:hypothetical protein